jgi:hypothetical protein
MSAANELVKAITAAGLSESRGKQTDIGPSQVGSCARKLWLQINGAEKTNSNLLRFSSMMGTAIHSYIQQAFHRLDPFGERYLLETEVYSEEAQLRGHVDMFDKQLGEVIDWKSTKMRNLAYFPSRQQRWQVQLYGWLIENVLGQKVNTVTLVAIPRDGTENDIVYHSEPYDANVANEAFAWLSEVKFAKHPPAPEKDAVFCRNYCEFYDKTGTKGCAGRSKSEADSFNIPDPIVDKVAQDYLRVSDEIRKLEAEKDGLKGFLEGANGTTVSGLKIAWSSVAGRKSIDEAEVLEKLGYVPFKVGKDSARLSVKATGGNDD